MKHNIKITALLLGMFLIAQFIGLYVASQYMPVKQHIYNNETGGKTDIIQNYSEENKVPYGMQPEEYEKPGLFSIILSFIIAICLILVIMKYKWRWVIRIFFFFVITIALAIFFNSVLKHVFLYSALISSGIALIFSFWKIFKPNFLVHNITELLIYPGIAPVFIIIFNPISIIILLIIISVYDMWAVWHSGIMQKMAKFQIEEAGVFGGLFIPYLTKKLKAKIAKFKKFKLNQKKKIKISLAMLGGGDIIFPIITSGVFLREFGLLSALSITMGAFAGLLFLFIISKKKKFYPAMPFITSGIFFGLLIWKFLSFAF